MKKYTPESKLSLGNLKNNSKQTGVLDLKPVGIVHSIGYKQVQIGQKESTVASDFLARHHQDSMNAYYMNQSQIINQTNRNIEFIQKRQVIERKIDEINEQLKNPYIPQNQQRSLYDIKNQYEEQIEQLELKENPDIMKKIQELTNALIQSETQKQVLTKEIQEKDIAIVAFNEISQMLPSLQASVDQMPTLIAKNEELQGTILENEEYIVSVEQALKDAQEIVAIAQTELPLLKAQNEELQASVEQVPILQAQIQELQTTIAMGVFGIQEPNVEPNITQDLEAKLKLKGEIKGDMRMFKMGKKLELPDDKIKELFVKVEKFEDIKGYFINHPERLLVENGYESEDITESLIMGESN
jgi:chromosome segregation ATPase